MSTHHARRRACAGLRWIGQAVSLLLLVIFSLAAMVLIIIPMVTGSQTYSVLTGSMAPTYPPGTLLVVKPTDFDSLQTGDVVTYQIESGRPDVVTHRIIGFSSGQDGERQLLTQGDNNDLADETPVMEIQVRGELFYAVPYVGFLAHALGQTDRSWIITALAVTLIGLGILSMIRGILKDRREARDRTLIDEASAELDAALAKDDAGPTPGKVLT